MTAGKDLTGRTILDAGHASDCSDDVLSLWQAPHMGVYALL